MSLEEFVNFAKDKNLIFDMITFFEVLEHQDNPKKFLKNVKEILKPSGIIVGSVPNRDSYFHRELNQILSKYADYPPHHFLRFSPKALFNTLQISGFREVQVFQTNFPFKYLPSFIERKLGWSFINNLKFLLKKKILGDITNQSIYSEKNIVSSINRNKIFFLRILKTIRMIILLPIMLPFIFRLKNNGVYLFFIGKR